MKTIEGKELPDMLMMPLSVESLKEPYGFP